MRGLLVAAAVRLRVRDEMSEAGCRRSRGVEVLVVSGAALTGAVEA